MSDCVKVYTYRLMCSFDATSPNRFRSQKCARGTGVHKNGADLRCAAYRRQTVKGPKALPRIGGIRISDDEQFQRDLGQSIQNTKVCQGH